MKDKSVGIIGGMGPEATINLMQWVIKFTPARNDQDHIHMVVDNDPKIPSRIKALIEGTGESPLPRLQQIAKNLEQSNVDLIAIPCNTAHYYHADIQKDVNVLVLNMIQLVVRDIVSEYSDISNIGLLASDAVHNLSLYEDYFTEYGVKTIKPRPDLQEKIMQGIVCIKHNNIDRSIVVDIQDAINELVLLGSDVILIACTELSIVANNLNSNVPVYDANKNLAKHIVKFCKNM